MTNITIAWKEANDYNKVVVNYAVKARMVIFDSSNPEENHLHLHSELVQ